MANNRQPFKLSEGSQIENNASPRVKEISSSASNDQTKDAAKQSDSGNATLRYDQLPNELQVKIFSHLNEDLAAQSALLRTSSRSYNLFQPQRLLDKLLPLAADATQPAVDKLLAFLDKHPDLLLVRGNVITRGGDDVRRVTLYEFCLGAGDPRLAAKISHYFKKIPGGKAERERQYSRYKPHIDAMQTQAPYDLNSLINIIISSSDEDVTACLYKNFGHEGHESELSTALQQFREDHAPRVITKPCMHYNYNTLQQAFNLLVEKWSALSANDTNDVKCRLVACQVIGYLQRRLPAIDRFAFSRAFKDKKRNLKFKYRGSFPNTSCDVVSGLDELGFDHIIFAASKWHVFGLGMWRAEQPRMSEFIAKKTSNLQKLCNRSSPRPQQPAV